MESTQMIDNREMFEAWAYSKKWNIFRVRDMGIDRYVDDFVDGAWNGWQASAQREGYKLVPLEPSEGALGAIRESVWHGYGYQEVKQHYVDIYKAMIGVPE